jgi:arylsulfatase A-like enzyme
VAPFTNFKGLAVEGGIRAPLMIRYPAVVSAGVRTDAFAYVTDVSTLLEFAGVDASGKAAAVLSGRSMVPLLTARADHVQAPDQAIGYEAAGGAAVYRGESKPREECAPYGDRKWRLYNLRNDPNEAKCHRRSRSWRAMLSDSGAYAARNGIIEVPADYDVIRQARANAAATSSHHTLEQERSCGFIPLCFTANRVAMDQSQLPGNRL